MAAHSKQPFQLRRFQWGCYFLRRTRLLHFRCQCRGASKLERLYPFRSHHLTMTETQSLSPQVRYPLERVSTLELDSSLGRQLLTNRTSSGLSRSSSQPDPVSRRYTTIQTLENCIPLLEVPSADGDRMS